VANRGDIGGEGFLVIINEAVELYILHDVSGGDWVAIDDFDGFGVFELEAGEVVLAGEFVIYKSIPGAPTINKSMGFDLVKFIGQGTWDN
jgi:hypothetical protein